MLRQCQGADNNKLKKKETTKEKAWARQVEASDAANRHERLARFAMSGPDLGEPGLICTKVCTEANTTNEGARSAKTGVEVTGLVGG